MKVRAIRPDADGELRSIDVDPIDDLRSMLRRALLLIEEERALNDIFRSRLTDTTHLTFDEAARFLGVSVALIRKMRRDGRLNMETIPGTKKSGFRIEELRAKWMPLQLAKRAKQIMESSDAR